MDTLEAVARGVGGLLAVLALVWAATRVLRSRLARDGGAALRVSQRVGLGRRSGVAVVEAGQRRFLVGVGESQVSLLAELRDEPEVPEPADGEPPGATAVTVRRVPDPRVRRPRATAPGVPDPRPIPAGTRQPPTRTLGGLVERARERTLRR